MRLIKFTVVLAVLIGSTAFAVTPTAMNFQGLLADTSGVPVADGSYSVTFRIYDDPNAGSTVWSESQSVVTTDGLFNVVLGSISAIQNAVFAGSFRYLGVQVGANPEMAPRTRLVTVPYAFRTGSVDGSAGGYISSSVSIGSGNVFTGNYDFVAGQNNSVAGDASTIAGGEGNSITGGATFTSIGGGLNNIVGGSTAFLGGGSGNNAVSRGSFVGGGLANVAGTADILFGNEYAAVVGGVSNQATGSYSFIGSGESNIASGLASAIPGGFDNTAAGNLSLAAGNRARANNSGSFVWADATNADVTSSADNQFTARTSGGARFYSNAGLTTGVVLAPGGGAWAMASDVNVKENIEPVDGREILEKLSEMPIASWNYITQDAGIRHIGPMAQDFDKAFGFGEDNRFINTIDADGVALAAAQQLAKEYAELKERVANLEKAVERLLEMK